MARRVSKRKKPPKEEYQLKERVKVESDVFDRKTLLALEKLLKKGIIKSVDYPISTGKEANVFRGTSSTGKFVAIKIYKIKTSHFLHKNEYLVGDPRFEKISNKEKDIIFAFAKKEYKNLQICEKIGVHAPRPIYVYKNIVVMEFLGEEGLPYPVMEMVGPHNESDLDSVLENIKKMYRAGLVHADVSEYNLLAGTVPYLIDFGQGVITRHPNAGKFLERDVKNVLRYFKKFGFERDLEKILGWIRN